jgi:hypothetical protein
VFVWEKRREVKPEARVARRPKRPRRYSLTKFIVEILSVCMGEEMRNKAGDEGGQEAKNSKQMFQDNIHCQNTAFVWEKRREMKPEARVAKEPKRPRRYSLTKFIVKNTECLYGRREEEKKRREENKDGCKSNPNDQRRLLWHDCDYHLETGRLSSSSTTRKEEGRRHVTSSPNG